MNKTFKIITGLIAIVVVILLVSTFISKLARDNEPFKIGFIGALTGVDPNYGVSMRNGLAIAIDEINKSGGVNGKQIQVIYEDGTCTEGAKAAAAAQKLINVDRVKIILDGSCSTSFLAYAPIAEANKIVVISSGATADSVTNAGDYIFRNVPSSSEAGKILADIVNQSNKNVAIISENSDYANTLKNSFLKEYGLLNGNLLANEEFTGSIKDFRTILSRIKSKNPEALVINPQASETVVQMVKQAKELGITSQIYIAYFTSPNVVRAGSFVNGMKVVDLPDFNIPGTKAYAFFQKYNQVYDTFPPYQFSSVLAYDLGYIVRDAIKNGNGIDPEKIKSYLYNIKSFNGLAGVYGFDINGDVVGIHHALKVINNGKLMTVIDKNN